MAEARWLTVGQAADQLGVSQSTVREYARTGRLHSTRLPSGHRRIDPASVEALRRELYGQPGTAEDPAPGDAGSSGG